MPAWTSVSSERLGLKFAIILKPLNKRFEVLRHNSDFVIAFLVDVNDLRLSTGTALSIVKAKHVVACGRTISKVDTDWRVTPLLNPKASVKFAA